MMCSDRKSVRFCEQQQETHIDYEQWQLWQDTRPRLSSSNLLDSEVDWKHERHMRLEKTTIGYEQEECWQKWSAQRRKSRSSLLDNNIDVRVLCHMTIATV